MAGSSDRYQPLPGLLELPGFLLRKLPPRRRRAVIAAGVALLLAAAAGAVLALPGIREHQRAQAGAEARRQAAAHRALLARYAREARPRFGHGPAAGGRSGALALHARRALVDALHASVLADARARAPAGDAYRSVTCTGYPKQVHAPPPEDDLGRPVATLSCLAATAEVRADATTTGSAIGQPYRARVDFEQGRYAWCQIVQQPGEGSIERGSVLTIPRACGGDR